MSGRVLLDTNAIINALNRDLLFPERDYSISIITEMELFSYPKLTEHESQNITKLLSYFSILNISNDIKNLAIKIRKIYSVKLPDSIICATAIVHDSILISDDKQLSKIKELNVLNLDNFCKI